MARVNVYLLIGYLVSSITYLAAPVLAQETSRIQVMHTGTYWLNLGYCAYEVTFDAGVESEAISNFKVKFSMWGADPQGSDTKEFQADLVIPKLGGANVDRYSSARLELPCSDKAAINVISAKGVVAGKEKDLLGDLSAATFLPVKINVGGK